MNGLPILYNKDSGKPCRIQSGQGNSPLQFTYYESNGTTKITATDYDFRMTLGTTESNKDDILSELSGVEAAEGIVTFDFSAQDLPASNDNAYGWIILWVYTVSGGINTTRDKYRVIYERGPN